MSTTLTRPFEVAADIIDPADGDNWRLTARAEQLPPDEDWTTLYFSGGRGSGKSFAGSHIFRELIDRDPTRLAHGPGTWACIAPTFGDARSKCIESEESGLLLAFGTTRNEVEAGKSATVKTWNRSIGEMYLHDGTRILIDGADDGAYRIQGENLRGAWCDEVGLWKRWKTAWDESLAFALRKGEAKRVATGTPKRNMPARALVKRLIDDPKVISRRLKTTDNIEHLSDAFIDEVVGRFEGTELGRQELEGILLEDVEGALWQREWLARTDREPKRYKRLVIGLDPSDGQEDGAEQAMVTCGLGIDRKLYVIKSDGVRGSSFAWLKRAVREASELGATLIVEKNHGGEPLIELLEQAMEAEGVRVPYQRAWASTGKHTRADPVAGLYEQGTNQKDPIVFHVGDHTELEDQMVTWVPGEPSPDRLDALVWAISHLMGYSRKPRKHRGNEAVPYTEATNGHGAVSYA